MNERKQQSGQAPETSMALYHSSGMILQAKLAIKRAEFSLEKCPLSTTDSNIVMYEAQLTLLEVIIHSLHPIKLN